MSLQFIIVLFEKLLVLVDIQLQHIQHSADVLFEFLLLPVLSQLIAVVFDQDEAF